MSCKNMRLPFSHRIRRFASAGLEMSGREAFFFIAFISGAAVFSEAEKPRIVNIILGAKNIHIFLINI